MIRKYAKVQIAQASNTLDGLHLHKISGSFSDFPNLAGRLAAIQPIILNPEQFIYVRNRAISALETYGPNGNHDGFPKEELMKSYATFISCPVDVDHMNVGPEDVVGIVLDAVYVPLRRVSMGKKVGDYVENILAIDRQRAEARVPGIIKGILDRQITDTSMGVDVEESECSICGKIARTEFEYCDHIRFQRGEELTVTGAKDAQRVFEINKGLAFFEDAIILPEQWNLVPNSVGADPDAKMAEVLAKQRPKVSVLCEYVVDRKKKNAQMDSVQPIIGEPPESLELREKRWRIMEIKEQLSKLPESQKGEAEEEIKELEEDAEHLQRDKGKRPVGGKVVVDPSQDEQQLSLTPSEQEKYAAAAVRYIVQRMQAGASYEEAEKDAYRRFGDKLDKKELLIDKTKLQEVKAMSGIKRKKKAAEKSPIPKAPVNLTKEQVKPDSYVKPKGEEKAVPTQQEVQSKARRALKAAFDARRRAGKAKKIAQDMVEDLVSQTVDVFVELQETNPEKTDQEIADAIVTTIPDEVEVQVPADVVERAEDILGTPADEGGGEEEAAVVEGKRKVATARRKLKARRALRTAFKAGRKAGVTKKIAQDLVEEIVDQTVDVFLELQETHPDSSDQELADAIVEVIPDEVAVEVPAEVITLAEDVLETPGGGGEGEEEEEAAVVEGKKKTAAKYKVFCETESMMTEGERIVRTVSATTPSEAATKVRQELLDAGDADSKDLDANVTEAKGQAPEYGGESVFESGLWFFEVMEVSKAADKKGQEAPEKSDVTGDPVNLTKEQTDGTYVKPEGADKAVPSPADLNVNPKTKFSQFVFCDKDEKHAYKVRGSSPAKALRSVARHLLKSNPKKLLQVIGMLRSKSAEISEAKFWDYIEQIGEDEDKIEKVVPQEEKAAFKDMFYTLANNLLDLSETQNDGDQYASWGAVAEGQSAYKEILKELKKGDRELYEMAEQNESFAHSVGELAPWPDEDEGAKQALTMLGLKLLTKKEAQEKLPKSPDGTFERSPEPTQKTPTSDAEVKKKVDEGTHETLTTDDTSTADDKDKLVQSQAAQKRLGLANLRLESENIQLGKTLTSLKEELANLGKQVKAFKINALLHTQLEKGLIKRNQVEAERVQLENLYDNEPATFAAMSKLITDKIANLKLPDASSTTFGKRKLAKIQDEYEDRGLHPSGDPSEEVEEVQVGSLEEGTLFEE